MLAVGDRYGEGGEAKPPPSQRRSVSRSDGEGSASGGRGYDAAKALVFYILKLAAHACFIFLGRAVNGAFMACAWFMVPPGELYDVDERPSQDSPRRQTQREPSLTKTRDNSHIPWQVIGCGQSCWWRRPTAR